MTEQPVNLEALDDVWAELLDACERSAPRKAAMLRPRLTNAYPALAAELRALRAEQHEDTGLLAHQKEEIDRLRADLDKARVDLGEAVKAVRVFLGHDDRFQVAVGGNPIAVDLMLAAARALLARLEGEQHGA